MVIYDTFAFFETFNLIDMRCRLMSFLLFVYAVHMPPECRALTIASHLLVWPTP
jgi:hypothetical protein